MTRINFTAWFAENKLIATLSAVFLTAVAIMGYLTWSAWDGYSTALQEQETMNSKLVALAKPDHPFPNDANLKKLNEALTTDQSDLKKLQQELLKYRIPTFAELEKAKPQDRPQLFQDALRSEVTKAKATAIASASTLPATFYLGLGEYENSVPKSDDVLILAKRLTVLDWVAGALVSQNGVLVDNFSRLETESAVKTDSSTSPSTGAAGSKKGVPSPTPASGNTQRTKNGATTSSPTPSGPMAPYSTVGGIQITFRCSQEAFRNFVNVITAAPYFLIIENLQIQNTTKEAPKRNEAQQQAPKPTSGKPLTASRLHFVVGGPDELLNIAMKIRILEFPDTVPSKADKVASGVPAPTTSVINKDKRTAK